MPCLANKDLICKPRDFKYNELFYNTAQCNIKGIFYIGKIKAPKASFCIHPSTFDKRTELKGSSVFNRGAILLYKSIFGPDLTTRL